MFLTRHVNLSQSDTAAVLVGEKKTATLPNARNLNTPEKV